MKSSTLNEGGFLKKYNILVADDIAVNRRVLADVLIKNLDNINILEAKNGLEVLEIIDREEIDLLILDLIMPQMDGYEVLKRIKINSKYSHIPVIVNSGISDIKSIKLTLEEGAIDYFIKPLSEVEKEITLPLKSKNALLLHEQNKIIYDLNMRITKELRNAKRFQEIILPVTDKVSNYDTNVIYQPSMGVSGDFFDFFEKDGKLYFMVADVSGHGIVAGMISSMIKILFRKVTEQGDMKPSEILESMNQNIFNIFDMNECIKYLIFTAFVGVVDKEKLFFCNAGQPYPILFKNENPEFIKVNGLPLGIIENPVYNDIVCDFAKDDSILIYTDGLFCSGNKGDFVDWEKVLDFTKTRAIMAHDEPKEFLESLLYYFHLIHKESATDYTDDVALILINRKRNVDENK
jgi:sigma-B regulation protein RsbU (phosphoserine phosphatase)